MESVSVIILTYNEQKHIKRCIQSVEEVANEVIVVDSDSTDDTREIAAACGARVVSHKWPGCQAAQFNWALDSLNINSDWILRLDADELLLAETAVEIRQLLSNPPYNLAGCYLKRRVHFQGKWIKHGGYYPIKLLRLWRNGKGRYEEVEMDEHVILSAGTTITLKNDFVEYNLNSVSWWIAKHNEYSTREVQEILKNSKFHQIKGSVTNGTQEKRKRWMKNNVYYSLPMFARALLYFNFRYFIQLGFLDGRRGLMWHFLQGCWYRFLVDVKLYEAKKQSGKKKPLFSKDAITA